MRSQRSILVLAILAVASSTALANHPVGHVPPSNLEPAAALLEMATDGYVVEVTRASERVFEIRVLHQQELTSVGGVPVAAQYAFDRVDVRSTARTCATNAACGNEGIWLHGLRVDLTGTGQNQLPHQGFYPAQTHAVKQDLAGSYLEVTITQAFSPTYQGAANAVVTIDTPGKDWVRGMYNAAKLVAPLDALDAVPQLVRFA